MLNLIPALILFLVNGPAAPLPDSVLATEGSRIQREADSRDCAGEAIVRLALVRLGEFTEEPSEDGPDVIDPSGNEGRPIQSPPSCREAKGHSRSDRTRDGPGV